MGLLKVELLLHDLPRGHNHNGTGHKEQQGSADPIERRKWGWMGEILLEIPPADAKPELTFRTLNW